MTANPDIFWVGCVVIMIAFCAMLAAMAWAHAWRENNVPDSGCDAGSCACVDQVKNLNGE